MKKSILIVLPVNGFNEFEYKTVKNALENSGVRIFVASDTHLLCKGENGLKVKPDVSFYNIHKSNFDGIVIIGGRGIREYWDNLLLQKAVKNFYKFNKTVAAICCAPIILSRAGILDGKRAVCFPDDKKEFARRGIDYQDVPVVVEERIITARDYNSSDEFILTVIQNIS